MSDSDPLAGLESGGAERLWDEHAPWWRDEFTDGVDPEYVEQILPLATELLSGFDRVLDIGAGEGQVARQIRSTGAGADTPTVVAFDATLSLVTTAAERGGGVLCGAADASAIPARDAAFDAVVACLVFEHVTDLDAALSEVARVLRPGGRFVLFVNHPMLQTPGSGWIEDYMVDPPEFYWRLGPYLTESAQVEEVHKDVFIPFVHRPLSTYVNALFANGLSLVEMREPSPPPGFLAKSASYAAAAAIPRLMVLVCERSTARDGER